MTTLIDIDLSSASDIELAHVAASVRDEYRRRALEAGDPEAVADEAFKVGFGSDGMAVPPWVTSNMVVCPGGKDHSSASSHRCRFSVVDSEWSWNAPDRLHHEVRHTGKGASTRTMSLFPLREGLVVEVITSKFRSGKHERLGIRRFEVHAGELVEVQALPHRTPDYQED